MADKRISQLVDRGTIANNDVVPIVVSGAVTTNKATISSIQTFMQGNLDLGVTSVGLSMPSAFVVSNSPVTASGNISVTGAGTVSQYIRGDGSLADFPQGGGGGGASVNYYLNGSVSQGTIGGIAYRELSKTPILGAGTDFTINADGYIASFITDAGDPSLLEIPGGNWNFETYFQASSGGGTPTFYVELYKVNSGGTATLIASNSGSPELIAFGTNTTPYFSSLAVPTTTLALTDRLAIRYYVAHSGRTITLHTENNTLCQIITTFTTGLTALNGLTAQVQNFATGTSGTDFGISSSTSTHTFNLPTASATNRGLLSSGDWTTFNNKAPSVAGGYVPYTGAAANVDLGVYNLTASAVNVNGSGSNAGVINLESNAIFPLVNGYGTIGSGTTNQFNFYQTTGAGVFRGAILSLNGITASATRTYTLPDADGTLALTSQIPTNPVGGTGAQGRVAYWDSTGTITSDSLFQWNDTFNRLGIGRTPTVSLDVEGAGFFSTSVTAQQSNITADGAGVVLQGYVDNNLRIAVRGSGYNSGGRGGLLASTGDFSSSVTAASGINAIGQQKAFSWQRTAGTASDVYSLNADSGSTYLQNDTTSNILMSWLEGGNVGIQTTAPTNLITLQKLGSVSTTPGIDFRGTLSIGGIYNDLDYNSGRIYAKFDSDSYASARVTIAYPTGLGTFADGLSVKNGNVGIGTASPESKLHISESVAGQTEIRITNTQGAAGNTSATAAINFVLQNGAGGSSGFVSLIAGKESDHQSAANVDDFFAIRTTSNDSTSERMRITSGGHLLIGTQTSNNFPLEIEASSGGPHIYLKRSGAFARFYMGGLTSGATQLIIDAAGTGGVRLDAGSTGWVSASDIRLKDIEKPIENAVESLSTLQTVYYSWKDSEDKSLHLGLIAQEVEDVFPELVSESSIDEMKGVNYTELIPVLIKAIQELKAEIDSLKTK